MNAFARRGACPALSAPMRTGDGLLVRLNPVAGGISPKALIGLCESALSHGNGIIEVTQRGSIQIRGLTASSARRLAAEVDALGIIVRTGVPVETGPLAGLDPDETADPRPLAEAIRIAIDKAGLASRLGPKVSVVVDGGGRFAMGGIMADVRLVAERRDGDIFWRLAIGDSASTAWPADLFAETEACNAVVAALEAIAENGLEGRGRDLDVYRFKGLYSVPPPSVLPDISPSRGEISHRLAAPPNSDGAEWAAWPKLPISPLEGEMSGRTEGGGTQCRRDRLDGQQTTSAVIGVFPLSNTTHVLGVALPFGSMPAERIADLARAAADRGATEIRPALRRTLLLLGLVGDACPGLQTIAKSLGFVTDPADPRVHVAVCPGAPACASGRIETRAVAETIAANQGGLLDGSFTLHISGCAKGCAHPSPAALTLVGGENGAGLVVEGTANELAASYSRNLDAASGLGRIAALVRDQRRPGENSAACLARLGIDRLATAFAQERA